MGQNSTSHSILRLSDYGQTSSQLLTLSSTPDFLPPLCRETNKTNDMIVIVPTDVLYSGRMVLVTGRTAEVHSTSNDELSSITAHPSNEIV